MGAFEDLQLASNARQRKVASRTQASSPRQDGSQPTSNGHFRRSVPLNGSFSSLHNTPMDKPANHRVAAGSRITRQQTASQPHEPVVLSSDTEADGDDEEDEDSDQDDIYAAPQKSKLSSKRRNGTPTTRTSPAYGSRPNRNPRRFSPPDDSASQSDDSSSNRVNGRHASDQEDSDVNQLPQDSAKGSASVKSAQASRLHSAIHHKGPQKSSFLSKDRMNGGRHKSNSTSRASPSGPSETLELVAPLPLIDLRDSHTPALNTSGKPTSSSELDDFIVPGIGDSMGELAAKDIWSTMSLPHRAPRPERSGQVKSSRGEDMQIRQASKSRDREILNETAVEPTQSRPDEGGQDISRAEHLRDSVAMSETEFPLSFQAVEQAVRVMVHEILNDNIYTTKNLLARARAVVDSKATTNLPTEADSLVKGAHNVPEQYVHDKSPFSQIQPPRSPSLDGMEDDAYDTFNTEIIVKPSGIRTSTIKAPKIKFKCSAIDVPKYYQYARLKDNLLSENVKEILIEPFRDDPNEQDHTDDIVKEFYMMRNDEPSEVGRRQWYMERMDPLLSKLGISWTDILRYLLDSNIEKADENDDVKKAIEERQAMLEQTGASQGESDEIEKLINNDVLDRLPTSSRRNLYMAALLDAIFFEEAEFSLFSLAKANIPDESSPKPVASSSRLPSYRSLTCRICFIHDCREHGLIFEDPKEVDKLSSNGDANDDDPEEGNEDKALSGDGKGGQKRKRASLEGTSHREIASPTGFNHKYRLTRDMAKETVDPELIPKPTFKPPEHLRDLGQRRMVIPCNHEGTCEQAQCRCFRRGIYCEKICGCAKSCPRRYPGCKCAKRDNLKQRNGSRLCRNKCKCFELNRECDPDLCGNCGVDEVLDPANKYNDELQKSHCGNCGITKGVPMKTYLTNSPYHGFGIILGEPAKPNDFIMEYKGEILTEQEATRREDVIYPRETSYFYTADKERIIDATLAGSKHRFVNHSDGKTRNCYARVKLCSGVARLGLYAGKPIKIGEELLFNYMMPKDHMVRHGGSTKRPAKPKRVADRGARKQSESAISQLERVKQYWRDTEDDSNQSTVNGRHTRNLDIETDNDSDENSAPTRLAQRLQLRREAQATNAGALTETEGGPSHPLRTKRSVRRAKDVDGFMTEPEGRQRSAARQTSQRKIAGTRARRIPDTEDEDSTRPDDNSEFDDPSYRGSGSMSQADLNRGDAMSDTGEVPSTLPRSGLMARELESLMDRPQDKLNTKKRKATSRASQDPEIQDSTAEQASSNPSKSGEVVVVKQTKRVRLVE